MKHTLIAVAALLAVVVLIPVIAILGVVAKSMLNPVTPPLLEQATAASGWVGGCPPLNEKESAERALWGGEALSPELNRKLAAQFPPGSDAGALVQTLSKQGFQLAETCQNDFTIRRAYFRGMTRGSLFETHATIYWKADGDKLVWTKGFLMFVGL